jgi:hypothetical protein
MIYKTLVRPVLLYGSETWVLPKREENRLLVYEWKVLPTIYGPKILDGVYRSRYNFKLDRESNRLRYAGHMIRGAENLLQRALFSAKPDETKEDQNLGGRMA